MKSFEVKTKTVRLLADTTTPVSIYLKIRDIYPNSLLLESSDYHGNENSYSYICLKPIASFEADNGSVTETYPDGSETTTILNDRSTFNKRFSAFIESFVLSDQSDDIPVNGLFGYMSYDAVEYFEKIKFTPGENYEYKIPDVRYHLYKYIIAINHYQNILNIIENRINGDPGEIEMIETLLNNRNFAIYPFRIVGDENQDISDDQYKAMVSKGREHCLRGDVFQVVLSLYNRLDH